MKLKTRARIARAELLLVIAAFGAIAVLAAARPHGGSTVSSDVPSVILAICLAAPTIMMSWRRLRSVRAQLAELGPDAEPKIDLWSAPGAPGVLGLTVVVVATAAALIPALTLRP